jgi:hypothetical protein
MAPIEPRRKRGVLDYYLGESPAITKNEEPDVTKPPPLMKPTGEANATVDLLMERGCPDACHGGTPDDESPLRRPDGGPSWCHRTSSLPPPQAATSTPVTAERRRGLLGFRTVLPRS